MKTVNEINIDAYEVYFRRDGQKRSVILAPRSAEQAFRSRLKRHKRKYLGSRPVKLAEVV